MAGEVQPPVVSHQLSWRWYSDVSTPLRSPGHRVIFSHFNAIVKVVKSKNPFKRYQLCAARMGCPHFACAEVPIPRAVFDAWLLGWDLGKGTEGPCSSCSGKQEMGRVVRPVHAKLRASGSFIHTVAELAFDIDVSLRWSSVTRLHLKSCWGADDTFPHMGAHTSLLTDTQTLTEVRRNSWSLVPPKKLLFISCGWLEDPFWKRMSVWFYNSLIRQIKRAFLLVFSNQNMPQSLFTYLLNFCCPSRMYSIFAMARVSWSPQLLSSEEGLRKI